MSLPRKKPARPCRSSSVLKASAASFRVMKLLRFLMPTRPVAICRAHGEISFVGALAGALSLRKRGMLGIAMGSSEAAGFMDKQGRILGWLNELAFAPVDYNPN